VIIDWTYGQLCYNNKIALEAIFGPYSRRENGASRRVVYRWSWIHRADMDRKDKIRELLGFVNTLSYDDDRSLEAYLVRAKSNNS